MAQVPLLLVTPLGAISADMNAPTQSLSAGHPRFVDVAVFLTVVDPVTGVATAVLDTTSALVLSTNRPDACVLSVHPTLNRRVVLTAGSLPPGSADVGWSATVQSNPASPAASALSIPGNTIAPPNLNRVDFVAEGDA